MVVIIHAEAVLEQITEAASSALFGEALGIHPCLWALGGANPGKGYDQLRPLAKTTLDSESLKHTQYLHWGLKYRNVPTFGLLGGPGKRISCREVVWFARCNIILWDFEGAVRHRALISAAGAHSSHIPR